MHAGIGADALDRSSPGRDSRRPRSYTNVVRPQDGRIGPDPELTVVKSLEKRNQRRLVERAQHRSRKVVMGLLRAVNSKASGTAATHEIRTDLHSLICGSTVYAVRSVEETPGKAQPRSQEVTTPQWTAMGWPNPTAGKTPPSRTKEDGVLLVLPVTVNGHRANALIDSGATHCYMAPSLILAAGLHCVNDHSLLELADGTRVHSQGRAPNVTVIIGSHPSKIDCTVTKLLNGIELVLGVNWLQATNPLIDWSQPRLLIGHNKMVHPISAQWLPSIHKTGTVKDVNPDDISNTDAFAFAKSLEKLQAPKF